MLRLLLCSLLFLPAAVLDSHFEVLGLQFSRFLGQNEVDSGKEVQVGGYAEAFNGLVVAIRSNVGHPHSTPTSLQFL